MPPYGSQTNAPALIGKVCKATVITRYADHCDLRLENGERIRLYQHDSCAVEDPRLMRDLPEYSEWEVRYLLVTHRRTDANGVLYYGNERWAKSNPWENLALQPGEQLEGKVIRAVLGTHDLPVGYLIQLDTTLSIGGKPNRELQPDILVYLPISELPWEDGSGGIKPVSGVYRRIVLAKGDQVKVVLNVIHRLPLLPEASLLEAMQRQNDQFWGEAIREGRGAYLKEGLHKPFLPKPDELSAPETWFDLAGCRILLVDDQEDSLERLAQILVGNGACVHSQLVMATPFSPDELAKRILVDVQSFQPNLILIDNALPQKHDGLALAGRLFALNRERALPCALISHHFLPEDIEYIKQKEKWLLGALLRPITPEQLWTLCRGEVVWSDGIKVSGNVISPKRMADFRDYYLKLVSGGFADALVVLETVNGEWRWEHGEGDLPFLAVEIRRVLQESDLHLLADKRLSDIYLKRGTDPDSRLLGGTLREAAWFNILSPEENVLKLVGLGWKTSGNQKLAEAMRDSMREKHLNQAWQTWAQLNANFISSGLTIHSLIHEYRQYLNQFQIGLDILQKAIEQQRLEFLMRTHASMEKTWREMLALETVLLKGQANRVAPAHIPDLLETVEALMKAYAKETRVDFRIINKPRLSLGIAAANLLIPLTNLVSNACKHHSRSSERKVGLVTQIQQDNGQYWLDFHVRDNGGGIPSHQVRQLFQAGMSFAHDAGERHGIGLWLARTIAHRIGGDVVLSSNLRGLGSCFTLRVPLSLG
jgi:signal transduction histidine kinase